MTNPTFNSMEQQLAELYREKEILDRAYPGVSAIGLVEIAESVRTQLDSLLTESYERMLREVEQLHSAFPGLSTHQIIEYARLGMQMSGRAMQHSGTAPMTPSAPSYLPFAQEEIMAKSLEAQLCSLYEEQEQLSRTFKGMDARQIVEHLSTMVGRLESLYARAA